MSLKTLPTELITKIFYLILTPDPDPSDPSTSSIYYFAPPSKGYAPSLSVISRTWQSVAEQHTFSSLSLTQHDLPRAVEVMNGERGAERQKAIRQLKVTIELDSYDEAARLRKESEAEQRANSEVFTAAVRGVFELVKGWDPACWEGLCLALEVGSVSDVGRLEAEEAERVVKKLPFSVHRRYERSVVQFLEGEGELPDLPRVGDLQIQHCGLPDGRGRNLYRAVDPATVGMLVMKCRKSLRVVRLNLMDWPRGDVEERKRRRRVLAKTVDGLPPRVRSLSVCYWGSAPRDENCDPPNLLGPGEEEDVLSVSLRGFYVRNRAEQLDVHNTILGPEFFRHPTKADGGFGEEKDKDEDEDDEDFDESWGRNNGHSDEDGRPCSELQDLRCDFSKATPDGRWLYKRPEKDDDEHPWHEWDFRSRDGPTDPDDPDAVTGPDDPDPELDDPAYANKHCFRIVPDLELINPLMKTIARAMRRMPALQDFQWGNPNDWPRVSIEYNPNFDEGGGELWFRNFGMYEDGEAGEQELIDTGRPLVDDKVVETFKEMLSARDPVGEIVVEME